MNSMTVSELSKCLGLEVGLRWNGFVVKVIILDAKKSYGQTRFSVRPSAGYGVQWVNESSLIFNEVL